MSNKEMFMPLIIQSFWYHLTTSWVFSRKGGTGAILLIEGTSSQQKS